MILSLNQLDLESRYSYADYLTWQFEQMVELFKGRIMPMAAPSRAHQKMSSAMHVEIGIALRNMNCGCEVYSAPFDVRLVRNPVGKTHKEIYSVVQPDLCIVCDSAKLDDKGCIGAPDLIIEIISEGSAKRDVQDKFELYQENGVREYWLARPNEKTVERFFLEHDLYTYKGTFTSSDTLASLAVPGITVDLTVVFA